VYNRVLKEKYSGEGKELPTWIVLTDSWKCRAAHGMPLPSHVDEALVKTGTYHPILLNMFEY
jgi:hypothetical protein